MLQHIPSGGMPSAEKVIAHIKYLSLHGWNGSTDLELYIKDVIAAYKFLEYKDQLQINLQILEDGRLWCDLDAQELPTLSKEQFRLCWKDAKTLRITLAEEKEKRKFGHSILNQFPRLLRLIDVEAVRKPARLPRDGLEERQSISNKALRELWKLGRFCDIELNVHGEPFRAHRVVLAAASGYWRRALTGNEPKGGLDINQSCSKETVLGVLRYIYTGELPLGWNEGAGKLVKPA
ncbi:hypothetical protein FN846DRAFT_309870 [Sphaerosporella brunnea]|uniref:BTB domain-containing protein n=1 Tax=Sphaerosporella brunnea TaxID=1250544 RepID=A0A5J5F6K0_9PEZI|nr:hypothetical protein FN846DRAFT_309870 [Sphaerosporella brunnea]